MPSLAVAMIFIAVMIAFVLLVWAAGDDGEKHGERESRESEEPGELEPARIAA
jgi:hypothetical protein